MRAGRSLDALLAAYRLGRAGGVAAPRAAGEAAGLEPRTLYLLAESIFAYIDELSGESIEGYAMEQAAAAGELQRLRRRLAGLLVQDPPAGRVAVEAAALAAGWALPAALAAVVTEGDEPDRLAMRLGTEAIGVHLPPHVCALGARPRRARAPAQLARPPSSGRARVRSAPRWLAARRGERGARHRHARAGAGGGDRAGGAGLLDAADHSLALLLNADRRLARDMASGARSPRSTPRRRPRASASPRRCSPGCAAAGAPSRWPKELHVHPQTVRYRLGRLRELYGDRLEEPDFRFELELALRSGAGAPR